MLNFIQFLKEVTVLKPYKRPNTNSGEISTTSTGPKVKVTKNGSRVVTYNTTPAPTMSKPGHLK
jgi:hypothetical protein